LTSLARLILIARLRLIAPAALSLRFLTLALRSIVAQYWSAKRSER
jgi:hypothetical protein